MSIQQLIDNALIKEEEEKKKCSTCKEIKSIKEFYKRNNKPVSICKQCVYLRVDKWTKNNKEKYLLNRRIFYKNNSKMKLGKGKIGRDRNKNNWLEFLVNIYGTNPKCQICNKELKYFNDKEISEYINKTADLYLDDLLTKNYNNNTLI